MHLMDWLKLLQTEDRQTEREREKSNKLLVSTDIEMYLYAFVAFRNELLKF